MPLCLVTSTDQTDDCLVAAADKLGILAFHGSLNNVLDRACEAAQFAKSDAFARLCGDRPFLPLQDMKRGLLLMQSSLDTHEPYDLITSQLPRPVPPALLTEIIRTDALLGCQQLAVRSDHYEHVTTLIYENLSGYRVYPLRSRLQLIPPCICLLIHSQISMFSQGYLLSLRI